MMQLLSLRRVHHTISLHPRLLHSTAALQLQSPLTMPALSPTMTSGSITSWSVKEGEAYRAGDVLLGIETDKAAMDVEAMEDGIMGKILIESGTSNVPVGTTIAILAEEGDDLTSLVLPAPSALFSPSSSAAAVKGISATATTTPSASSATPTPPAAPSQSSSASAPASGSGSAAAPRSPSVARLLVLNADRIADVQLIRATGRRGMLTKSDVLAHLLSVPSAVLGSRAAPVMNEAQPSASTTTLSASPSFTPSPPTSQSSAAAVSPLTVLQKEGGAELRRLILAGLSRSKSSIVAGTTAVGFDAVLQDYDDAVSLRRSLKDTATASRDTYLDL